MLTEPLFSDFFVHFLFHLNRFVCTSTYKKGLDLWIDLRIISILLMIIGHYCLKLPDTCTQICQNLSTFYWFTSLTSHLVAEWRLELDLILLIVYTQRRGKIVIECHLKGNISSISVIVI